MADRRDTGAVVDGSHVGTHAGHRRIRGTRRTWRWARWAAWPAWAASGTATPYRLRAQRFSRWCRLSCCSLWWPPGLRRFGIRAPHDRAGAGSGVRAGTRSAGHRPGSSRPARRRRGGARPGGAARRTEVGRPGDARLRAGRRGCGVDVATLARFVRPGRRAAGLLRRAAAGAARLGLGGRRKGRVGALPERLGGRCGSDQPRARRGRGVAGRAPCGGSPGRVLHRCWIRCRAGCAPTC